MPYAVTSILLLLLACAPPAGACGNTAVDADRASNISDSELPVNEISSATVFDFAERQLGHPSLIIVETATDGGLAIGYAARYRAASF